MKENLKLRLIELESKIKILEHENEALAAKAEEILLLNRAFEEIDVSDDMDSLLMNTLESISVLLNIPFSGLFNFKGNVFKCVSSYALFSSEDTVNITFSVAENKVKTMASCLTVLLDKSDGGFRFEYPSTSFKAEQAVVVSLDSEILRHRYFVFVNDENGENLAERLPLFDKITRIISSKLERIYYQNELGKLNVELEEIVELRTQELHSQNQEYLALYEEYKTINEDLLIAKEKAEESDRLKTSFIQNLSHEIRTPLNGIMGFSSLLAENYNDKNSLEHFSGIINQLGKNLLDIINDILDISQIESGQLALNIGDCNIHEVLGELQTFFMEYRKQINKEHIEFNLQCACNADLGIIKTDRVKLKQILVNLIGNALKFTENGAVECGCRYEKEYLLFYVSDTGIGIPKNMHSKVFERFEQVQYANKKKVGGTGLGLPIAKALANQLGGSMWVESEVDKGSTFYFQIKVVL